jgi:hypothetical protein
MDDLFYREFPAGEAQSRWLSKPTYTVLRSFDYCMKAWTMITQPRSSYGRLVHSAMAQAAMA